MLPLHVGAPWKPMGVEPARAFRITLKKKQGWTRTVIHTEASCTVVLFSGHGWRPDLHDLVALVPLSPDRTLPEEEGIWREWEELELWH